MPVPAVALSSIFIALGFMNATKDSSTVFGYFVSLVTVFGALNWIAVLVSYLHMIRAMKVQGVPREIMPYRNPLLPWGAYIALFLTALVIIFSGYAAFILKFQVDKFLTSYIGIPVYVINIIWWKFFKKTKRVRPEDADLVPAGGRKLARSEDRVQGWLTRGIGALVHSFYTYYLAYNAHSRSRIC